MDSSEQLSDQKRRLLENSEKYRRALAAEFQNVKASTAWVPRTVGIVRATSPLVALAAPVIGFLIGRKKKGAPDKTAHKNGKSEKGMVAKALILFEIFRKAKPFWDHFQRARERRSDNSRRSRPAVREN
jgi:hypothetical protein